jgi:hypothetical protein
VCRVLLSHWFATDETTLHTLIRAYILRIASEMVRLVVCSLFGMAVFALLLIRILLSDTQKMNRGWEPPTVA